MEKNEQEKKAIQSTMGMDVARVEVEVPVSGREPQAQHQVSQMPSEDQGKQNGVAVEPEVEPTRTPSARIEAPDGPCRIILEKSHETGERTTLVGKNCTLKDFDDLMLGEPDKMHVEGEQAQAQMPSPTAQEPLPTPVEAEPDPESSPSACEVRYKRNEAGGYDVWVGEGCSKSDLASISKGQAQVSNITLECYERWKEQYGQSEPGTEEGQGDGADLSSELSEVERLLKRVVTEKMEFIVEPEIPAEEALAKTAAKKKK